MVSVAQLSRLRPDFCRCCSRRSWIPPPDLKGRDESDTRSTRSSPPRPWAPRTHRPLASLLKPGTSPWTLREKVASWPCLEISPQWWPQRSASPFLRHETSALTRNLSAAALGLFIWGHRSGLGQPCSEGGSYSLRSAGTVLDAFSVYFFRRTTSLPSRAYCEGSCQIQGGSA